MRMKMRILGMGEDGGRLRGRRGILVNIGGERMKGGCWNLAGDLV
jgi:hypothetical protein